LSLQPVWKEAPVFRSRFFLESVTNRFQEATQGKHAIFGELANHDRFD
jgi:hypothetical protein